MTRFDSKTSVEDYIKNMPINFVQAIKGITFNCAYELEGQYWLETDCADYNAWAALPHVVEFEGRKYGRTGWNSDSCKACYSTNKLFATY